MLLENLDFFNFFKDENGLLYDGFGIGGVGVITLNQMVNAVNIDGTPKSEIATGWGGGSHNATFEEIIKNIFIVDDFSLWKLYDKNDRRNGLSYKLIKIWYVNQEGEKNIIVDIPAVINCFQYECLYNLNEIIQSLVDNINVIVNNTGFVPYDLNKENSTCSFNSLSEALVYYKRSRKVMDNIELYDKMFCFLPNEIVLKFDGEVKNVR